jgi:hypothetical protein
MIDRMLKNITDGREKVSEIELAAKSAKRALDVLEMSCAAILFEMAEEVNDLEAVNRCRKRVSKAEFVTVLDCRDSIWNGDIERVKSDWNGESFDVDDGKPDIWFWTSNMVACFFSDNIVWAIFDQNKILQTEEVNGTEEEKPKLH